MHCNSPFLIHEIYKASGNFTFCHHLFIVLQALEVAQKHYGEDSKELIPIYQCLDQLLTDRYNAFTQNEH